MVSHNSNLPPNRRVFTSDNVAGASSEVVEAITRCNFGPAAPYGGDQVTRNMESMLRDVFERDVSVFLVSTGSAANALALSVMTPPWGNIYAHPASHIDNDECGAPVFYTGGAKVVPVNGNSGKIDPVLLRTMVGKKAGDVHSTQPACVSISQATEVGSVYSVSEVGHIGEICQQNSIHLHMDGARFANALVALGCSPAELTWKAGISALSFGATKNGVLAAEAVVIFNRDMATEMGYRRKRAGQLTSKMRFMSAQVEAYLQNDLWLSNAQRANGMTKRLAEGLRKLPGIEVMGPVQTNILFCRLPQKTIQGLISSGFSFYHDRWEPGVVRLVTSFATETTDIDDLLVVVKDHL